MLLTDCRTGVKDETSLCHARTLPGLLTETLGIAIEEYEALSADMSYAVTGRGMGAGSWTARQFADWVSPKGAEVLAGFAHWHMKDFAAATRNRCGKGWGYHVGAIVKEDSFYDTVVADVLARAGVKAVVTPPAGVEASIREGAGKKILFLVNHTEEKKEVSTQPGWVDALTGAAAGSSISLEPYGVAAIRLS